MPRGHGTAVRSTEKTGRLEHMGRGPITGPGRSQSSWEQAALERRGAGDRRAQGSLGSSSASRARAQRPAETWHTTGGVCPQSLENRMGAGARESMSYEH